MATITLRTKELGFSKPIKTKASIDQADELSKVMKMSNDIMLMENKYQLEILEGKDQQVINELQEKLVNTDDDGEKAEISNQLEIAKLKAKIADGEKGNEIYEKSRTFNSKALDCIANILGLDKTQRKQLEENKPSKEEFGNYLGYLNARLVQGLSDQEFDKAIEKAKQEQKLKNGIKDPKK